MTVTLRSAVADLAGVANVSIRSKRLVVIASSTLLWEYFEEIQDFREAIYDL